MAENKKWHLGGSELEQSLGEFQHGLICLNEAFDRYMGTQLQLAAKNPNLNGSDCVIMHAIRTQDRPKSTTDIQHWTNRTDVANIQYSIRKLVKDGLVQTVKKAKGRGAVYELTKKGLDVTDRYIAARKEFLKKLPHDPKNLSKQLNNAVDLINLLTGIYDQSTRSLSIK